MMTFLRITAAIVLELFAFFMTALVCILLGSFIFNHMSCHNDTLHSNVEIRYRYEHTCMEKYNRNILLKQFGK